MDLLTKDAVAKMEAFDSLVGVMTWTTAVDFDLAALYIKPDGTHGLVYFGGKGSLTGFPFISLDRDAGVGDTGGENEETVRISKDALAQYKSIHLICWDYGEVQSGRPARFDGSDLQIIITPDKGEAHKVTLDAGETGNCVIVASINMENGIPQLVNTSKIGTLKGLKDSQQFVNILNQ